MAKKKPVTKPKTLTFENCGEAVHRMFWGEVMKQIVSSGLQGRLGALGLVGLVLECDGKRYTITANPTIVEGEVLPEGAVKADVTQ